MSDVLAIYLRDHHAGSRVGVGLARRLARSTDETVAVAGERLLREIEEDVDTLEEVMARLGVPRSRVKDLLAALAERLGRLKPNGYVLRRSPLSGVVETEALLLGVTGKQVLWRSLAHVAEREELLEGIDFEALGQRADSQLEQLRSLRDAADSAFV